MDWCLSSFEEANHPPVAKLNHNNVLEVQSGESVKLDASNSNDPDNNQLSYEWIHYREAGTFPAKITPEKKNEAVIFFEAPKVKIPSEIHFVVAVTDNGKPTLTRYQRVIIKVNP